jgi:epoxyqueuosine reductase
MPFHLDFLNQNASQTPECLAFAATPIPSALPHSNRLEEWIHRGYNANMNWMARNFDRKNYNTAWLSLWKYPRPLQKKQEPIAAFAHGKDYHITIGAILRNWAQQVNGQPFVDSMPIAERELAAMAGLGFIGKNTMLINPKLGSAFFIGGILLNSQSPMTSQSCSPTKPQAYRCLNSQLEIACKDCRKCLDACPNKALTEDGFLDARRCASYLTIEHRGEFTEEQKKFARHSIFGCDICQRVCPYNTQHLAETEPYFSPDENEWKKKTIKGTPLWRAGSKNLRRNLSN